MSIRYCRWVSVWMIQDTLSMKKTMRLVSIWTTSASNYMMTFISAIPKQTVTAMQSACALSEIISSVSLHIWRVQHLWNYVRICMSNGRLSHTIRVQQRKEIRRLLNPGLRRIGPYFGTITYGEQTVYSQTVWRIFMSSQISLYSRNIPLR